jgi:hypothetical protein
VEGEGEAMEVMVEWQLKDDMVPHDSMNSITGKKYVEADIFQLVRVPAGPHDRSLTELQTDRTLT